MLIWPWVRFEVDHARYLEHANMIVFIMKKSDLDDETDHSCSIYRHQLIFDFIHLRKEIQSCESLHANFPLCKQADNMESTYESEPCCLQHCVESLGCKLKRVKYDVDIHKCQLHRLKGEVRESVQQVAEDLHEVRSIHM